MVLIKNIFLRVVILTVFLIALITASSLVFDIVQNRIYVLELTTTKMIVLAPRVEEMAISDDRSELKDLLDGIVQANPEIDYILIEKDVGTYVHTFATAVPESLLARQDITDSPSVWDYVGSDGEHYYDVAMRLPRTCLHIGLNRSQIDRHERPLIIWTLALTLIMVLVAVFMSGIVARRTTNEVNLLTEQLRKNRDELEKHVEERTNELNVSVERLKKENTERKLAEENLKLSEEKYRTLFEHAPVAILIMDSETGRPVDCNDLALEFTGLSKEQFLSSITVKELSPPFQPDGRPSVLRSKELLTEASKGKILNFEWTFVRPDGEQRIGFVQLVPFQSEDKKLVLLASVDITELKSVSKQLQLSETRYKMLVESAEQVICRINEKGTFLFMNQFAAEGLGGKPEDLIGKSMWDLFTKKFADKNMSLVTKVLKSDVHVFEEYEAEVREEKRWYQVHIWPVHEPGETIKSALVFANDITAAKQTELDLQESEIKYKTLYESSHDAIMILAPPDWNFTAGNKTTVDMFKAKDEQEFISKSPWQVSPEFQPDGQPSSVKAKKMIDKAMKEGSHFFEWQHKRLNGQEFPATVLLTRIKLEGKDLLQATVRDITEFKQAEKTLQLSEERYRTIFNSCAEGILVADIESKKFMIANPAICRMLGYTEQELKKMSVHGIHPKEDLEHVISEFETQAREEKEVALDIPCLCKDGEIIYVNICTSQIEVDRTKCLVGLFTNITERYKARQELESSYERLQTLSDAAFEGIVIHEAGKIIDANNKFQQMFGYDLNELKNMDAYNLITQDSQQVAREHISSRLEGPYEVIGVKKDGSTFLVEVQAREMEYQGRQIRFAAIRDISGRKQLEKERQELEDKIFDAQKHAYMGSACAILAHDINQPLTVINMLLGKALEIVDDNSCCPEIIEKIEECLVESRKAAVLSRTLRKYVRDSAFDITDTVNLDLIAKRIVSLLSSKAEEAKMNISTKGLENLPGIQFNEISLEQIFLVLIQNAIDAADPDRKGTLEITGKQAGDKVELTFSDNCGGIAPGNLEKIFEPFFTTKADKGRIGLGLEIVQQILISCGGEIHLESSLGKGTTFYVTLPFDNT
ncbi:MAG: PAS domain S-box protein [Planctomycetota bacterium]